MNGQIFFFTEYMANDPFSEPPRRADSKNPIFIFFADFWVWVTSEAQESVSLGFWGSRQLSPLGEGGGGLARGLYRPPPPSLESPVAPGFLDTFCG